MPETKADTVQGLGFKDKDKALETIKNLNGRDPDYQKLAIKGLIGRAKRTLTLTKDEEKLQNIKDAMQVFEDWLKDFDKKNLSKENRSYLPLASILAMLPLKDEFHLEDKKSDAFLAAYKSVSGDYKNLRTVSSGAEGDPTWDIVRNTELKKLLSEFDDSSAELWDEDLPTKEHMKLILWAYSPEASRIKKNIAKIEEKLGDKKPSEGKKEAVKRKSDGDSSSSSNSSSDDESPKKKSKKN